MAKGRQRQRGLIHRVTLPLPDLPAPLEGLRIAHLSDLHIHRPRARFEKLARLVAGMKLDLAFFTGDYIDQPGDEPAGLEVMRRLCDGLNPRLGSFGVFGNHDPSHLRETFEALPIRWLVDDACELDGLPLVLVGLDATRSRSPDSVAMLDSLSSVVGGGGGQAGGANAAPVNGEKRLRLLLCHYPTYLPVAADLGADVAFSGHTHGGQCRLAARWVPYNACDLPSQLSAGLLRHRDTLCAVTRGLGETSLPLRVMCAPQMPVYTLRRGPMPGQATTAIENVQPW